LSKKTTIMKLIRLIFLCLLLVSISYLSFVIYQKENEKRIVKTELIELSKVKYGLFNVDEWNRLISDIISKRLEEFNLEDANRAQIHEKISKFLEEVLDDFEEQLHFSNDNESMLGFSLKNAIIDFTGIFDSIREQIPGIANQIIDFLNDPENRDAVRDYLLNKLNDYTNQTFSKVDYSVRDSILKKYQVSNQQEGIQKLSQKLILLNKTKQLYIFSLFGLIILTALAVGFLKGMLAFDYLLVTLIAFVLLANGLLLPMIDIDARVSELNFKLLGEKVTFSNQVLYYKSKSILEVVQLMIAQTKPEVLAVGILIFAFSVLFPISKLICTIVYLFSPASRKSDFINFMAFKTGKWSMADVMIVAIFMAYIGFSSIISEQLKGLEGMSQSLELFTTNHSSLQTGFFLFTGFVILSLLLSGRVQEK